MALSVNIQVHFSEEQVSWWAFTANNVECATGDVGINVKMFPIFYSFWQFANQGLGLFVEHLHEIF